MRDENVAESVAIRRFRVEHATAVLRRQAADRWPTTFGGMWIDTAAFDVRAAFTADAAANVAALAAEYPFPELLRPVTVARSYADLRALQQVLRDDAGLVAAVGRYDSDIDLVANQVVLRFPTPTAEIRDRVVAAYGAAARVEAGVAAPASCAPSNCYPTMMGGLDIFHAGLPCTGAFTAAIGSYRYVLSAGHCYTDSGAAEVQQGNVYYGDVTSYRVAGRVDAERVRRFGPGWRESSKFHVYGAGELPRDVKAYRRYADIGKGDYVGKSGSTTWTTRGYVLSVDYAPTFYVPNGANFVTADFCADNGDSGGPVWSSTTAIGIVAFGLPGTCRISNGRPSPPRIGGFGAIEFAQSALGVTLLSGVNIAPVAHLEWRCTVVMECAFNGFASDDDDGEIRTYLWNFGDGFTSTEPNPTHSYTVPGRYTVTLTVKDNDGAAAVRTVTVDSGIGGTA